MLPAEKARASWRKRLKRPGDGNATMSEAMREQLEQAAEPESQQEEELAYGEESQPKVKRTPKKRFDLSKQVRARYTGHRLTAVGRWLRRVTLCQWRTRRRWWWCLRQSHAHGSLLSAIAVVVYDDRLTGATRYRAAIIRRKTIQLIKLCVDVI
jgi:hypothetical protein